MEMRFDQNHRVKLQQIVMDLEIEVIRLKIENMDPKKDPVLLKKRIRKIQDMVFEMEMLKLG